METERFNPEMLALARESRGYTQTALARKSSYSQSVISRFESGVLELNREAVLKFARILGYPPKFFGHSDTVYGLGSSFLFHRKRQTTPVGIQREIQADINIARMRIDRLLRGLTWEPANEFPTFEVGLDGSPEDVARFVRAAWNLPDGPVRNLTHAVEQAGAIVMPYTFPTRKVDGISVWVTPTPPLFFVNNSAPADRTRRTLAHETGHMVMHRIPHADIEAEADSFANEFLMPALDIKGDLQNLTLAKAASLKLTWRVSIQSLVRRARDLGCILEGRYRSLMVQISRSGMRRVEPNPIAEELPRNIRSIIGIHRTVHGYSPEELADLTFCSDPSEFDRVFSTTRPRLRIAR